MLKDEWKLSHSCLSSSMNLGLLHPSEVIDAVENAYRSGKAPINSVEGYIRQILGWRDVPVDNSVKLPTQSPFANWLAATPSPINASTS